MRFTSLSANLGVLLMRLAAGEMAAKRKQLFPRDLARGDVTPAALSLLRIETGYNRDSAV